MVYLLFCIWNAIIIHSIKDPWYGKTKWFRFWTHCVRGEMEMWFAPFTPSTSRLLSMDGFFISASSDFCTLLSKGNGHVLLPHSTSWRRSANISKGNARDLQRKKEELLPFSYNLKTKMFDNLINNAFAFGKYFIPQHWTSSL